MNNRNFSAQLLFRKTSDFSEPEEFHKKCDNQGITIVFIETKEKYKFGGYTELGWEGSGGKKDKSNFLFSLNKKEKYISKNDNNSIYCDPNYGPKFGSFYKDEQRESLTIQPLKQRPYPSLVFAKKAVLQPYCCSQLNVIIGHFRLVVLSIHNIN